MTEEEFDENYTDASGELRDMGIGRAAVRDLLLVAAALGSKSRGSVKVTFTREGGYVVTEDGEVA